MAWDLFGGFGTLERWTVNGNLSMVYTGRSWKPLTRKCWVETWPVPDKSFLTFIGMVIQWPFQWLFVTSNYRDKRKVTLNHLVLVIHMDVSKNSDTPKSSILILIGFSIMNHPFQRYPYFWKHTDHIYTTFDVNFLRMRKDFRRGISGSAESLQELKQNGCRFVTMFHSRLGYFFGRWTPL